MAKSGPSYSMEKIEADCGAFDVSIYGEDNSAVTCLFSAGRGGNPLLYGNLLDAIASRNCRIVAPHFDMLSSSVPTASELERRLSQSRAAIRALTRSELPLVGVGHSIGTAILLILAGATARTLAGETVHCECESVFDRLALLTPTADFFRVPGAFDRLEVSHSAALWAGSQDAITPPAQAQFLKAELSKRVQTEISIDEHAGHFTFMDKAPPQAPEPHPDRAAFLAQLGDDVSRFVAG